MSTDLELRAPTGFHSGPVWNDTDAALSLATLTALATGQSAEKLTAIDQSAAAVAHFSAEIADAVSRYLPQILGALGETNLELGHIGDILERPEATAAAEHLQRAEELFARRSAAGDRLLPEARKEYLAALEHEPYEPLVQYRLGQIAQAQGEAAEAAQRFSLVQRYSPNRSVVAAATLLEANCYAPDDDRRSRVLAKGCEAIDDCPDLFIAASTTGGPETLSRALVLAPRAAESLRVSGLPHVEEAARIVLESGRAEEAERIRGLVIEGIALAQQIDPAGTSMTPAATRNGASAVETLAWTEEVHDQLEKLYDRLRLAAVELKPPNVPKKPVRPHKPKPPGRETDRSNDLRPLEVSNVSRSLGKIVLMVFLTWITVGLYGIYKLCVFASESWSRRRAHQQWEIMHRRREEEYLRAREFYEAKLAEYEAAIDEHEHAVARVENERIRVASLREQAAALAERMHQARYRREHVTRPIFL